MGKTFKSGYMSLGHSFNSLYNFQCKKKANRRKRKIALRNDCKWIANDCNKSEVLNMTISNLAPKNTENIKRPSKIGYCANSGVSYIRVVNKILPNYSMGNNHNGLSWVYEEERIMFEDDFQFKNLNEKDKIEYLIEKEKNKNSKCNYLYELNNMKKQLKRRGAIGYFKGHDKDKKDRG